MKFQDSLLVTLVKLVDRVPMPVQPTKRGWGHPIVYPDRSFLKVLVIMIVSNLHTVNELLSVLAQPTEEMRTLRLLLMQQERFPTRRTWERRLKAIPATLPTQTGCFSRHLVSLNQPWATSGRVLAIDSTLLRARGGVWHQKHREKGEIPLTSIDPEAHGPNRAGMAGCTDGNCTSFRSLPPFGFPWRLCSLRPMWRTASPLLTSCAKFLPKCASS